MKKKGMLYKRTFSAAASALMAISAIAPMSVFAEEFEPVTTDVELEAAQGSSEVYLNTTFNDDIKKVRDGFAAAAVADTPEKGKAAVDEIIKYLPGNDVYLAIRTHVQGMITNRPGRPQVVDSKAKSYKVEGKMSLNIDLGDLLGLTGEDRTFVSTARDGLNNLSNRKYMNHNLMSETLNGDITFNVTLPEQASFDGEVYGDYYDSGLVKKVTATTTGNKATITLHLNPNKTLAQLTDVVLKGRSEEIEVELPYTVNYSLDEKNQVPAMNDAVVFVDENTDMYTSGKIAGKTLHIKANKHEFRNPSFKILNNLNASVKEEPVKPSKPSGTLTGGYPSSKPGSSNSSSVVRPMHRLYNPKTGEHFYTQSAEERDNLVRGGWNNEGIGWHAPAGSSTPVYRVFNPNSGDHHYTTNLEEYQTLTRIGWNAEGIGWYSESDKGAPIYRLYNKKIKVGSHHYTQNAAERDKLVNEGWVYEGIAWYAMK